MASGHLLRRKSCLGALWVRPGTHSISRTRFRVLRAQASLTLQNPTILQRRRTISKALLGLTDRWRFQREEKLPIRSGTLFTSRTRFPVLKVQVSLTLRSSAKSQRRSGITQAVLQLTYGRRFQTEHKRLSWPRRGNIQMTISLSFQTTRQALSLPMCRTI